MGLGGLAFAMMGCDVVLTDVAEVIPLLQRNFENNLSRSALQGQALEWSWRRVGGKLGGVTEGGGGARGQGGGGGGEGGGGGG